MPAGRRFADAAPRRIREFFDKIHGMTLILRAVSLSDPGLVRTNNEDEAHAGGRLIAVADGMGGLPAGEVASRIAITAMAALEWAPTDDAPAVALAGAVAATTRQIRALVDEDPTREGMGTTMTAVLLAGAVLVVAHIGDSRGYLLRGGVLQPLTRDDTFVQELVEQGTLSPAEARRHPQRSLVTRAVQAYDISPAVSTLPA